MACGILATASAAIGRVGAPPAAVDRLTTGPAKIIPGERLSDWLLRQPVSSDSYPLALSWSVPAQRQSQAQLKHHLLAQLAVSQELQAKQAARQRLARWIEAMPVTGRVPVARADARWLQAHPDQDPVLDYDHTVLLPLRPKTVTVIAEDGRRCEVPHRAGAEAKTYLRACEPDQANDVARAWIIQPDGKVKAFNIARWNEEAQDEPAPGARIWAPGPAAGWTPHFSALLAEFLATQGIADESGAAPAGLSPLTPAAPVTAQPRARDQLRTANDWGLIGLLQTPSARMADAGDIRFTASRVTPYTRASVIFQPLDGIETGFRYNVISNVPYGPSTLTSLSYTHHSADVKVRLMQETALAPELALGFNDIAGTALFAGEYLVGSKRMGDLDFSLGLGWGNLGASNNLGNPLSIFGKRFNTRVGQETTSGGTVNTKSLFHGPAALFGGLQYRTPWENVVAKLEYDGNNYRHEPFGNVLKQNSHVNAGIVYRYSPSIDLSAGVERGNTVMFGVTFHGRLDELTMPKLADSAEPRFAADRPTREPDWSRTAADLADQTKWNVTQISRNGRELRVVFEEAYGTYWKDRIERAAAVLHRDAPADVDRFVLVMVEHGISMTERVIQRNAWVEKHVRYQAMAERFESIAAAEPRPAFRSRPVWASDKGPFTIGLAPSWQQTIGGPNGYVLYQAGVATPMELRLTDSTWISGKANLRLADNYSRYAYDAPSNLPRVRTYLREYQTTAAVTLPNLQVTHIGQLADDQFYSAYGGYLEPMFAGVGTEWLYRPWQSRFAFGVDVNRVRQRDFRQNFDLRNAGDQTGYTVNTGHATLYWDTGWKSTHVNLSAGQYLARDRGMTLEVNRTFKNGVTIGGWATKTNISSQTFGEGSFDKGIYVSIPFDAMLPFSSPSMGTFAWDPLTRDGGARLVRSNGLYGLTGARDRRLNRFAPAGSTVPGELDDEWPAERSIFGDLGSATGELGRQIAQGQTGQALLTSGVMVLGSALLDRPLANWARNHQTRRWNSVGSAASNLPLLLAAGTGILWWGAGGDIASETAWTGIKSAALTLVSEEVMKLAVGRARPELGLGTTHFTPLAKGAANSSFPSVHMGVAYALVTPFAQQYDAAWLYGLAGITAVGRIQQQKHFASDVVAGSLIGYGVGSLLLDQQHRRGNAPLIAIGADRSVNAAWQF